MVAKRLPILYSVALLFLCPSSSLGGPISDGLLDKLSGGDKADAILELPSIFGNVMSNPLLNMLSGAAKVNMMTSLMQQMTSSAQAPFMQVLSTLGLSDSATPFWISNDIALKNVDLSAVQALAAIPGLSKIREPATVKMNPVIIQSPLANLSRSLRQSSGQWGVNKIEAPAVWDKKTKGAGIIVAGIDSGVRGDHEALKGNYAGKWYDPIYGDSTPTDYQGHGTHTMGSIVGQTYGIGVAPEARWIACRGLDADGRGTEQSLKACAQWVQQQKPHVVSNSWGGGQGQNWFNDVIKAWRAAGIIPVFSIGNSGPNCRTANSPGDQPNLISVGSTKEDDTMSGFSSRGYSVGGALKPEVSGPGDQIPSAYKNSPTSYVYMSGTSMACPHVAGAVALMLSANPKMTFDQIKNSLQNTADRPSVSANDIQCGKPSSDNYPNNAYGYGRINVRKALGL